MGTIGTASIYSFYATKVISTGEGGMVATESRALAEEIRDLKKYDGRADYKVRFNYKMTDIQAALGIVQLKALESFILRRRQIAEKYRKAFNSLNLNLPPADGGHIYFRYVIGLPMDAGSWIRELARMGITCARPVHRPLHRYFDLGGYQSADKAWKQSLSIPIYPTLTDDEIDKVIESVTLCYEQFC